MRKRMNRRAGCCPIVVGYRCQKCFAPECLACRSLEFPCQSGKPSLGFPRRSCCLSGCGSESFPSGCSPSGFRKSAWAASPFRGLPTTRFHVYCPLDLVLTTRSHVKKLVGTSLAGVVLTLVVEPAQTVQDILASRWPFVVHIQVDRCT